MKENDLRTIICKHTSEMLDNPDKYDIYPTTKFYNNLIEAIEQYISDKLVCKGCKCEHCYEIYEQIYKDFGIAELKKGLK